MGAVVVIGLEVEVVLVDVVVLMLHTPSLHTPLGVASVEHRSSFGRLRTTWQLEAKHRPTVQGLPVSHASPSS